MNDEVEEPCLYLQEATTAERYRLAGQSYALERGYNVAESVYTGVCAETWYRAEVNDTVAGTLPAVQLEVICGDPLASRATAELDTIQALRFMDWARGNIAEIGEHADTLEINRWRPRDEAFRRTAMELASSTPVTTAAMLYTGAAAVARHTYVTGGVDLRDHGRVDRLIELTEKDQPLLALARRHMSDLDRAMQQEWVQMNWFEIAPAADDIVLAEDNASHSSDDETMVRHEVTHWLGTLPVPGTIPAEFRAYAEASAVALAFFCRNDPPESQDANMRIQAGVDDAVIATGAVTNLTDEVQTKIREAVRNRMASFLLLLDD